MPLPDVARSKTWVCVLAALALVACAPAGPQQQPPVLLFAGSGTSPNDVTAVKAVLASRNLKFATVDSAQLNAMSARQLGAYRLLIVPGGNYIAMGDALTAATAANVRNAVQGGLNYLGICAGGLLAGNVEHHGFDLAGGARFGFHALVDQGIHKAAVKITTVDGAALDHYWEDGPQFTGWGAVVSRYPDGTPAIVEGACGKGWLVLVGTHPEAPDAWGRGMAFSTPPDAARAYAGALVAAALIGAALPHF